VAKLEIAHPLTAFVISLACMYLTNVDAGLIPTLD